MTVRVSTNEGVLFFDKADKWVVTDDKALHVSRDGLCVASFSLWNSVQLVEDEKPKVASEPMFNVTGDNGLDIDKLFKGLEDLGRIGKKFLA